MATWSGAQQRPIIPKNGIYISLEDIKKSVVISDDVHDCPTRVISLEVPLNGMITPLSEVQKIAAFAKEHDIKMHCDGARLWEVVAAGAGTLSEYSACFDTLSLCFSKGLGAPLGSIVVGSNDTLKHCRWVRKMFGGGMCQPGVVTAAARVAVDVTFGKTADGQSGLLKGSHEMAKKVEAAWTRLGGKLVHPVHTNMCWIDLEAANCSEDRFKALCKDAGLTVFGPRLVTHYQIAQNGTEVLKRLEGVFEKVFADQGETLEEKVGKQSMYGTG